MKTIIEYCPQKYAERIGIFASEVASMPDFRAVADRAIALGFGVYTGNNHVAIHYLIGGKLSPVRLALIVKEGTRYDCVC